MTVEDRLEHLERSVQSLTQRVHRLETGAAPQPATRPAPPAAPPVAPWASAPGPRAPSPAAAPARRGPAMTPSRLLAAGGGVTLLLGVGFLLRYAVAQGWLGPSVRVLLALGGAAVLAVIGWRLERTPATRAVGQTCTATAAAGAYAAVVAAAIGYRLIPEALGLAAAFLIAASAAARGAWTRSQAVAALGVGGALVAPVLVRPDEGPALLAFLTIALAAGLAVAVRYGWTAIVVLAFVVVTPQVWLPAIRDGEPALLSFAAVHAALFLAACLLRARGRGVGGVIVPATVLALNGIAVAALGYWVLGDHLPALDRRPSLWLLGVAVAHLGAGAAWSRRYFAPPIAIVALAAGLLVADGAILAWTDGYVAAAWLAGVLGLVAGACSRAWLRPAAGVLVVTQLVVAALQASEVVDVARTGSLEALAVVAALCLTALAAAAVTRAAGKGLAVGGAATYLGLGGVRLLTHEAPLQALLDGPADPIAALGMSAALAGTALLLGQTLHRRFTLAGVTVANYAVSLAAVSLDPDGAGRVALTGLWAAGGGIALVAGRRTGRADLRRAGAALLGLGVTKAALIDTVMLSGTNRAVALLLCGTALVATAVAEARAAHEPGDAPPAASVQP